MNVPKYHSGDEILVGDRIDYAGQQGEVVFVIDTDSFAPAFPSGDWSYLGCGIMLQVDGYGLIHMEEPDEDLRLVGRSTSAP